MNSLFLKAFISVLQQMPTIAQEIDATIKAAETPEDARTKVKAVLMDLAKLIETLTGAL